MDRSNMYPRLAAPNARDGGEVHAKPAPDFDYRTRSRANRADIIVRQFSVVMSCALRTVGAALRDLVGYVVRVCAQEQMSRVAAWRVIAAMAHMHAGWNRAARSAPLKAMGQEGAPFEIKSAVSQVGAPRGASPRPTRFIAARSVNVVVQPLVERPMVWGLEALYAGISHLLAPLKQLLVRAGVSASNAARPVYCNGMSL